MHPYIGITDFTCGREVEKMLAVFKDVLPSGDRKLMVGAMMSYKTLHGLPTRWSNAFPRPEAFPCIYSHKHPFLLNTLHYADYEGLTEPQDLTDAIMIAGHRGPFSPLALDALQLDMPWPSPKLIADALWSTESLLEESTKEEDCLQDFKIILQVGTVAMERLDNDPKLISRRIAQYGNSIHCVLFDRSGGLGKSMDAGLLRSYILETKELCPTLSIAVAGGLGPDTMGLIAPLVAEFPELSWDAQGRLRKSGSALDPIDWDLAAAYIRKSGDLFRS